MPEAEGFEDFEGLPGIAEGILTARVGRKHERWWNQEAEIFLSNAKMS